MNNADDTLLISKNATNGIQMVDMCPKVEWFSFQMVSHFVLAI
jgi:hypothetical protein